MTDMLRSLVDRTALVTGASRGIGKAIALSDAGANVAVNYREREKKADETVAAIKKLGKKAVAIQADVSKSQDLANLIKQTESALGPVAILVNNAGHALRKSLDEMTEADFDYAIATNLKSAFLCSHAVYKGMQQRHWGPFINISSGAAQAWSARTTTPPKPAWKASPAARW